MALNFLNNAFFAGKVGIGETNPLGKLHVKDVGEIYTSLAGSDSAINFLETGGQPWRIGNRSADDSFRFSQSSDSLGTNVRVTFANGGNVGIGTSEPQRKLTIFESSGNAVLQLANATSGVGSSDGFLIFTNGVDVGLENKENGYLSLATNASEKIRISSAGAIRFNAYGAGYLKTDASGNITADSTVPGTGVFLPLAGGTMTGDTIHNDNVKSIYGTSSDGLEIYHSSTNSYIQDTGTGTLNIQGSTQVLIGGINGEVGVQYVENAGVGLRHNNVAKLTTESTGVSVVGNITVDSALLSNQENTDIDTGAEVVAQVAHATYTAAFFDFVIKKGLNVRSGTVYACHNGDTTPLVQFTETSTQDLGNTSDVVLSVDISGTQMRLLATVVSDDWSVKSLIRAL